MLSSSPASTASADANGDDANPTHETGSGSEIEVVRDKKSTQHEKHNKLEATVKWVDDDQRREQPGLMFDIQYHALYNTAFFKLRALVATKNCSLPDQVSLFMLLAPEAIQTLSLISHHAQELGPDTVCLRFKCRNGGAAAPALVVPTAMDLSHVAWKNKQSSSMWHSLQSLARATEFDVLCRLPRRVMSEARIQSLCEALSSCQVMSTPGHADLCGLYGGKGGKVVPPMVEVEADPTDDSLPAYQDIEPGPPMPPVLQDKTNKRRRCDSDTDNQRSLRGPRDELEVTVSWLVTQLGEYQAREALLVAELKEVHAKVAMLTSQHEEHMAKCTYLEDDLHDRVGVVEARLDELDEELEIRVECRVDETLEQASDSIKEELVDYIDETLPNRIQGALEEVTFSARF